MEIVLVDARGDDPIARRIVGESADFCSGVVFALVLPVVANDVALAGRVGDGLADDVLNEVIPTFVLGVPDVLAVPLALVRDDVASLVLAGRFQNVDIAGLADRHVHDGLPKLAVVLRLCPDIQRAYHVLLGVQDWGVGGLTPGIDYKSAAHERLPANQGVDDGVGLSIRLDGGDVCANGPGTVRVPDGSGDPQHVAGFFIRWKIVQVSPPLSDVTVSTKAIASLLAFSPSHCLPIIILGRPTSCTCLLN